MLAGSATSRETLAMAGAADADLFIEVTRSDEVSMLACLMAARLGARQRTRRPPPYSIPGPWHDAVEPAITLLIMDAEFIGGMLLVAAVLVAMIVLVVVSRARIERFNREGPRPFESRIRRDRRG